MVRIPQAEAAAQGSSRILEVAGFQCSEPALGATDSEAGVSRSTGMKCAGKRRAAVKEYNYSMGALGIYDGLFTRTPKGSVINYLILAREPAVAHQ